MLLGFTYPYFFMKNELLDPSGHIKLSVTDIQRSKTFYSILFKELGFKQIRYSERTLGG